jgi:mono/diheme cytochrome c family protein
VASPSDLTRHLHRSLRLRAPAVAGVAVGALAIGACGSAASHSGSAASARAVSAGRQVFAQSGCGGCHALAAAHTTGDIGPDLDHLEPTYAEVFYHVRNGGGGMPSFKGRLSHIQIESVARYVAAATQGGSGG